MVSSHWHEAFVALLLVAGTSVLFLIKVMYTGVARPRFFMRNIPGPPNGGLLRGHMAEVRKYDPGVITDMWRAKYGNIFQFQAFVGVSIW